MIRKQNRFDEYAYRVANKRLSDSVVTLEEGQWVTLDTNGELVIATGTQKAFIVIGSKRDGRDMVGGKSVRKVSYLKGNFEFDVTNFDPAGDYSTSPITPLKVTAGGILTPAITPATDIIEAYAIGDVKPDGYLTITSA